MWLLENFKWPQRPQAHSIVLLCWTAAPPQTFHNRSRWRSKQSIFLHSCLQRSFLLCFQLIWEALPGLGWQWTYCKKRLETSRNPGYRSVSWAERAFIKMMVQGKLMAGSMTQNQMQHLSYSWKEARGVRGEKAAAAPGTAPAGAGVPGCGWVSQSC